MKLHCIKFEILYLLIICYRHLSADQANARKRYAIPGSCAAHAEKTTKTNKGVNCYVFAIGVPAIDLG